MSRDPLRARTVHRAAPTLFALAVAVVACAAARPAAQAIAAPALNWTSPTPADGVAQPTGVSCPTSSLCVAVDAAGTILTSPDPGAPAPSWTGAPVDAGHELTAISCASASLCVAVDAAGNALVSTDAAAGAGTWAERPAGSGAALKGISCPTDSLCVAVDANGDVLTSTDPARSSWSAAVPIAGAALDGVSCVSASLCVAVDAGGGVSVSAEPTAGAGAWSRRAIDLGAALTSVSCASAVCVAVDAAGDALASSDPLAPAPTWSVTAADPARALASVSCAPAGLCVAVDGSGDALASEAPAGATPDWSLQAPDAGALVAVSCSAGSLCVALDGAGRSLSTPLPSLPSPTPVVVPSAPRPRIVGTPAPGAQLSCDPGLSAGTPAQLSYAWLRESEPIGGAGSPLYTVKASDEGRHLQCRVTASDAAGSASGTSAFVTVPFVGLPVATGETAVGRVRVRGGRPVVPIACSPRATHGCNVSLRLVRSGAGTTIGARRAHLGRGAGAALAVGLSASGRRLLVRRGRLNASLLVSATVIGSIEAALVDQPLTLARAHRRVSVRLRPARWPPACRGCAAVSASQSSRVGTHSRGGGQAARGAVLDRARGLAAIPYMGWDSYFAFGPHYSESTVLEQASDLIALGLARRGYRYVWLDVGWWQGLRAPDGRIALDRSQWPHGLAWLASTLHHAGLLLGLYTDAGENGCGGIGQGAYGHYRQDAGTFAAWGVDAVKVDFCGGEQLGLDPEAAYREFRAALDATGRPMLLSICDFLQPGERGEGDPPFARSAFSSYLFGPRVGNSWRTDGDVGVPGHVPFANVLRNLDADAAHPQAAGPGHWNDPDYLGPDQGMGPQQFRTQVGMWAVLAAPLMVSRDLGRLSPTSLATLRDEEAIAVDQDRLGAQGVLVSSSGSVQVWVKPLADGSRAVALLDRGATPARIEIGASTIGLPPASRYTVRDLWRHRSSSTTGPIAAETPGDGTVLLRVRAA